MGFLDALSGFISGVCSAISTICSAIGLGPIGTALAEAIKVLNPRISLIIEAIPLVIKIIELLAPEEIKAEELESGELAVKAEACKDLKPENYESYSEYIKAVHENVENDPAKKDWVKNEMKTRTEEDAVAHKAVSVAMAGKIVAEKLDTDNVDPVFLVKANAFGFDEEKTVNFIKELKNQELTTTDINKYFDGNLSTNDYEKAGEGVRAALGKIDPSLKTDEQKTAEVNRMFDKIDNAVKNTENTNS